MKKRKTISEAEMRYFLVQMAEIMIYLKNRNIIHREYSSLHQASNLPTTCSMKISSWNSETSVLPQNTRNPLILGEGFVGRQTTSLLKSWNAKITGLKLMPGRQECLRICISYEGILCFLGLLLLSKKIARKLMRKSNAVTLNSLMISSAPPKPKISSQSCCIYVLVRD